VSLSQLVQRALAARANPAHAEKVFIWRGCPDDEDKGEAQLQALKAAGRIGPRTVVHWVRWMNESDDPAAYSDPIPTEI
jgi:hypothetical protein